MTNLAALYSPKQQQVLQYALTHEFFMLINGGAKRSGKTVIDNDLFLMELKRVKHLADEQGVKSPQYILAGADLSSIQRNVLNEITNKYGIQFKFDKYNRFKLFGVTVCCFGHSKINDLSRIRGMTAYGAYVNESTLANKSVFQEIVSRCSGNGARIVTDTNPASPSHWFKKDYVDKADQKTVAYFHWRLTDNTFVSQSYIANIIATTPSGPTTERDINGAWVAQSGVCFPDFNRNIHYIERKDLPEMAYNFVGVDFGWEHPGTMILFGKGIDDKIYVLETWYKKYRQIEDWIEIGKNIVTKYGDILFYCDSARPEHIDKMCENELRAINARKDVAAGIALVDSKFKTNDLYIVRDSGEGATDFDEEIDTYAWQDNGKEAPVKENDDMMDALRYGVYSDDFYGDR